MKTERETDKPRRMWRGAMALLPVCMALMTLTSWTGCRAPRVIESHNVVTPVKQGQTFTAPFDGWFLSDSLYLRYRQAVADRIQEEQAK